LRSKIRFPFLLSGKEGVEGMMTVILAREEKHLTARTKNKTHKIRLTMTRATNEDRLIPFRVDFHGLTFSTADIHVTLSYFFFCFALRGRHELLNECIHDQSSLY